MCTRWRLEEGAASQVKRIAVVAQQVKNGGSTICLRASVIVDVYIVNVGLCKQEADATWNRTLYCMLSDA